MNQLPEPFETYAINSIEVALRLFLPEGWQVKAIESVGDWGKPHFECEIEETSSPYRVITGEGDSLGRAIADAGRKVRRL